MNMYDKLNDNQQFLLMQMIQKYQISVKHRKVLLKYYNYFQKILLITKQSSKAIEQIKILLQISLIFTQKSNFYKSLGGNQFPGIFFSINEILKNKSYSQIQKLIFMLQEILNKAKFRQDILKFEVQKLHKQIQQGLNQAKIMQKLFQRFYSNTIQNTNTIQNYHDKLMTFTWQLYIDAKNYCIDAKNHCIGNKTNHKLYLIISILQNIVLNSLNYVTPIILQEQLLKQSRNQSQIAHKKRLMQTILSILLEQSDITPNQLNQYKLVNQRFDSYFDQLISHSIIKSFSQSTFDYLSPHNLDINLRKIDRKISKEIQQNKFDLRILIAYNFGCQKQLKKTAIDDKPILQHKKGQKVRMRQQNRHYHSHRILNLDNCDLQMSGQSKKSSQIILPSNICQQLKYNHLIINQYKDQFDQYVGERIKLYQGLGLDHIIMKEVNQLFQIFHNQSQCLIFANHVRIRAYQLYLFFVDQAWHRTSHNQYYLLQESQSMKKCLLLLSVLTILANESDQIYSDNYLQKLTDEYNINSVQLFYATTYLSNSNIPQKFNNHLDTILSYLINEKLWLQPSLIENLIDLIQNYSQSNTSVSCILEKTCSQVNRILNYFGIKLCQLATQTQDFCIQQWKHKSLLIAMSIIIYQPQIIFQRYLNQILICIMFGVFKVLKINFKFQDLINIQKTLSKDNMFQRKIFNVKSTINSSIVYANIIEFYNNQFLNYLNSSLEIINIEQNLDFINSLTLFSQIEDEIIIQTQRQKQPYRNQYVMISPNNENSSSLANLSQIITNHTKQRMYISNDTKQPMHINSPYHQYNIDDKITNYQNQINRDPTRIKQRKSINERQRQLCVTMKSKHPIFQQFFKGEILQ